LDPIKICVYFGRLEEKHLEQIRSVAPEAVIVEPKGEGAGEAIKGAQIAFGAVPADHLEDARELRWMHLGSAARTDLYGSRSSKSAASRSPTRAVASAFPSPSMSLLSCCR